MSDSVKNAFNTRVASVMESLLTAAVCEITKIFDISLLDYRVTLSQSREEIVILKRRLEATEKKLKDANGSRGSERRQPLNPCNLILDPDIDPPNSLTGTGPAGDTTLMLKDAFSQGDPGIQKVQSGETEDKVEVIELEFVTFSQEESKMASTLIKELSPPPGADPEDSLTGAGPQQSAESVQVAPFIIKKEELVGQDPEALLVEESSPITKGFTGDMRKPPEIGGAVAREEETSRRGRSEPRFPQSATTLVGFSATGVTCVPCRSAPIILKRSLEGIKDCQLGSSVQRGNETEYGVAPEHTGSTASKGQCCAAQTHQVSDTQQRRTMVEPSLFHPVPASVDKTVSAPYQHCLGFVSGIPKDNRSVDGTGLRYPCREKITELNHAQYQWHRGEVKDAGGGQQDKLVVIGKQVEEKPGGSKYVTTCSDFVQQRQKLNRPIRAANPMPGNHQVETQNGCSDLSKAFVRSEALKCTGQSHTARRPNVCPYCGKSFSYPSHQFRHMLRHTGKRLYPCTRCDKSFITQSELNVHMRVHTGERPYSCTQCGKRFAQNGNLRAHQRDVHQGKRPFPCLECGKRFSYNGNLKAHQRRVHLRETPPCSTRKS